VVTVVQRLSGLQALSLLREAGDGTISQVTDADLLKSCQRVTNITAGLALEDGAGIVVYLANIPASPPPSPGQNRGPRTTAAACPSQDELTVFDTRGREIQARFVGLDVRTGLSLLQTNGPAAPPSARVSASAPAPQAPIRVLAPERKTPVLANNLVQLRLGEYEARLQEVAKTTDGFTTQFMLTGIGAAPSLIGGVAVSADNQNETLGLVIGARQNLARVMPVQSVLAAAARVRARQATVPRPLLGVQALDFAALSNEEAVRLYGQALIAERAALPKGVVLTGVLPQTPAEQAGIKPGDLLLSINGKPVQNTNDFSYILAQSEAGEKMMVETLRFTAKGQNAETEMLTFSVQLGATNAFPIPSPYNIAVTAHNPEDALAKAGLETLGLSAAVARNMGARGGRVVLSVAPDSGAARAGFQAGDIIETVNGRLLLAGNYAALMANLANAKLALQVLRQGRRITLELDSLDAGAGRK
jgi:serine protease Do